MGVPRARPNAGKDATELASTKDIEQLTIQSA